MLGFSPCKVQFIPKSSLLLGYIPFVDIEILFTPQAIKLFIIFSAVSFKSNKHP